MMTQQLSAKMIKETAFSMPFSSPSYPKGPYRFINREFLIITYETDMDALRAVVPEPLKIIEPIVKFEVIRMPDSCGFGDYTESGQVIPVEFNGRKGSYVHSMYLDDQSPILGGREIWGFPKKFAHPSLKVDKDTLTGTLNYNDERVATATMGFKYQALDKKACEAALGAPGFLLKIIPNVDGSLQICELIEYALTDIHVKSAYAGPAALELRPHVMAPLADLPVRRIISATHIISDLTLPYGKVVHDYLK